MLLNNPQHPGLFHITNDYPVQDIKSAETENSAMDHCCPTEINTVRHQICGCQGTVGEGRDWEFAVDRCNLSHLEMEKQVPTV